MPEFQNRERELQILAEGIEPVLLNVYGEAGIGKTRLLEEASVLLRDRSPQTQVFFIDLEPLADPGLDRPRELLNALVAASAGTLGTSQRDPTAGAEELVAQLNASSDRWPVLMFDTTEVLQEDNGFWQWLEAAIVVPLLLAGYVRQIFAGRVPVPWRGFQARSRVKLLHLAPLPTKQSPPGDFARKLVEDVFRLRRPALLDEPALPRLVDLVLEFSHGHPRLSQKLAGWLAEHWTVEDEKDLRLRMATEVVRPFIDEVLFDGIEQPWPAILWWASILDWFDTTTLRRYLGLLAGAGLMEPGLVRDDWDAFFIQGIHRLRLMHTVISWEEKGYRLYGVIRDIVRQCLAAVDPEGYASANLRAADMIASLADEFQPDEEEHARYLREAQSYRDLVSKEMML